MKLQSASKNLDAIFRFEQRINVPIRWFLLAFGALLLLSGEFSSDLNRLSLAWFLYALVALAFTLATWWLDGPRATGFFLFGYAVDITFVSYLIGVTGGVTSALFVFYGLLALRVFSLSAVFGRFTVWIPFSFGPLYVLVLSFVHGSLAFLREPVFLLHHALLWMLIFVGSAAIWQLQKSEQTTKTLQAMLLQQETDLAQKTNVLQRTATDLGQRVLELRTLQEVMRALTSTLRMEEVVALVVVRLANLLGASHCAVAVFEPGGTRLVGSITIDAGQTTPIPFEMLLDDEPATKQALASEQPLLVADISATNSSGQHRLFHDWGMRSCLIVPLLARQGPIGALYLGDSKPNVAFGEPERQLSASFAYFASTAIENARLYREAWEKGRELEAVVVGIGDGVIVTDPQMNLLLMNPVAGRLCNVPQNFPPGVPFSTLVANNSLLELIENTLHSREKTAVRELELPAADGHLHTFQALAAPVLTVEGAQHGVVTVLRDITTRVELERMKTNFLSVVSHELKTPLHSIKGFVEIILMGKTGAINEVQRDFLETVKEQTNQLQRLISDLLEYSRLEAGQIKLRLDTVQLGEIVEAVAAKLAPQATSANVHVINNVSLDFASIEADAMRIEQVLTNLIDNAIKFTPADGRVTISGREHADFVELSVSDTGIGIPLDEQTRVFDRFYQVDSGSNRLYKGTGLGLSICKHIVEHHGGRIWVESSNAQGTGATFSFTLPREQAPGEALLDFSHLPASAVSVSEQVS